MFINKTVFKRLLKEAYNGHQLKIGKVYGGTVIFGGYWKIWVRDGNYMPNWFKAVVIELIGELPDKGMVVEYGKGEPPQQTISENEAYNLHTLYMSAKRPYTVTPMIYEKGYTALHFLQNDETKEIAALPEELFGLIDFSNMEREECRPSGPASDRYGERFYWANEACVLELCGVRSYDDKVLEIMSQLSEIDFREDE